MMTMPIIASRMALGVLAVMLTLAVYSEIKSSRIPNGLTFSGMAAGLFLGWLQGTPVFWSSLGGLGIGFGFLFIFYLFGGVGGGDVKLMGAAGALMGMRLIQPALFYTALVGLGLALLMVIWRKDLWIRAGAALRRVVVWRRKTEEVPTGTKPVTIPYGLAIAIGCEMALLLCSVK